MARGRLGRPRIMASSALVGYGAGAFLGRSVIGSANPAASLLAAIMALLTLLRNHYGELSKALGLGLISTVGRVGRVRRRYPTGPHLRAILRGRGRRPFPPVFEGGRDNPWRYAPREGYEDSDPDFSMAWTVAAMALMGGFCGGNLPLIPAWMGGTAGAAVLAFGTTLRGAKGDLYRTMGMRVVALLVGVVHARRGRWTASERAMEVDGEGGGRRQREGERGPWQAGDCAPGWRG